MMAPQKGLRFRSGGKRRRKKQRKKKRRVSKKRKSFRKGQLRTIKMLIKELNVIEKKMQEEDNAAMRAARRISAESAYWPHP